jgi:cbb3-type cytochrome oxidase subunit 1
MFEEEEKITKSFVLAALGWAIFGMLVGLLAAVQLTQRI